MIRKLQLITLVLVCSLNMTRAETYAPEWESLNQREMPEWFGEAKFGIFIHWGIYSVPSYSPVGPDGYSEWYWNKLEARKDNHGSLATKAFHNRVYGADFPYPDFAPQFRAELFDPVHWAKVFKASGAKYVVPTSKHHDGYCMWPSKEASESYGRPWNAAEIGPHRDLLGETAKAVRDAGLEFGIYYSLMEWNNPYKQESAAKYVDEVVHPQFKDVVANYKPSVIFSDGEWVMPTEKWKSREMLAWLFNESPVKDRVVINDRWGIKERGKHPCTYYTSEYGAGLDGSHVWEENRGIGESFGFNRAETAEGYKTAEELIVVLADVVSRGGNLLLDIGPTADGRIPPIQEDRLLGMGKWLKVNGEAIYDTTMWRQARQWSDGSSAPAQTGNYQTDFDINDATQVSPDGKPYIEAFFTTKNQYLYVIIPQLTGNSFKVHNLDERTVKSVRMLGLDQPLDWSQKDNQLLIQAPDGFRHSDIASYPHCFRIEFN